MSTQTFTSRRAFHRFPEFWELTLLGLAPIAIFIVTLAGSKVALPYAMVMWGFYALVLIRSLGQLVGDLFGFEVDLTDDAIVFRGRFLSRRIAYADIRAASTQTIFPSAPLFISTGKWFQNLSVPLYFMTDGATFLLALMDRLERKALPGTYNRWAIFNAAKAARRRDDAAKRLSHPALSLLTFGATVALPALACLTPLIGEGRVFVFLGITAVPLLALAAAELAVARRIDRLADIVQFELPTADAAWEKQLFARAAKVASLGMLASTAWLTYSALT